MVCSGRLCVLWVSLYMRVHLPETALEVKGRAMLSVWQVGMAHAPVWAPHLGSRPGGRELVTGAFACLGVCVLGRQDGTIPVAPPKTEGYCQRSSDTGTIESIFVIPLNEVWWSWWRE